ncbi:hypothetical protein BWQ93_18560 [Sphingopyxis sp. QXT-31]|uniref:hypothetical protein n=1 Tax=Sphingopyxis sp. QXT-31 TaxID=1357916 RepID=UPI0009790B6E|nr:hypothetical protein [Sphingopyxis sp. QXT-31]AQA00235.1 hypothetical protein BWQ93_18560 [Sphingopyxis sp. QXT-31]
MTAGPFYSHYGFNLRSDLALPHLLPGDPAAPVDAEIRLAPIAADRLDEALHFRNWRAEPGEILFQAFGICRLLIAGGRSITVEREAGATDAALVSIILGTGVSALLMQRGILPMHACSIASDTGAILVIGRSGAGKSTLLGGLMAAGCTMLADDVTGVVVGDAGATAIPAFPAMRLWTDSLSLLGKDADDKVQVREDIEKYYVGVDRFHGHPMPVRAVVLLQGHNGAAITSRPVAMANRVEALARYVHRKNFLRGLGLQRWGFDAVVRLAQSVDMVAIGRPMLGATPASMAAAVMDHFGIDPALEPAA